MKRLLLSIASLSFAISFFVLFSFITAVGAQSIADFSIKLSPDTPGPSESVSASLVSFSIDLDRATIFWMLDGKTVLSGVGKKSYSFTSKNIGSASRLDVSVTYGGGTISKYLTITPGSVDFLWQAVDSYTPPFYRGKALPAPEATIKIVAMPDMQSGGSAIKPSNLVYQWSRNYNAVPEASGFGKKIYTFKNNYLDSQESVNLKVSSATGGVSTRGDITIPITSPFLLYYVNEPLLGMRYERALGGQYAMQNNEMRVSAEPYFFSTADKKNNLNYAWQLNGDEVPGSANDASSLVLRNDGGKGIAQVALSISHLSKIMQTAGNNFSVNFGSR